jgi:hypothetical protein
MMFGVAAGRFQLMRIEMATSAKHSLHFTPPLLPCESAEEFAMLRSELELEIKPEGEIVRWYVDDIAHRIWDIQRLRRYRSQIISKGRPAALLKLIKQMLNRADFDQHYELEQAAKDLARGWFENQDSKNKVGKLLRKFQMDEAAIDAEAFRSKAEDLERLDRLLATSASGLNKALRCIAEYREYLAIQLQHAADRILDNVEVPRLVGRSSKAGNDKRTEG